MKMLIIIAAAAALAVIGWSLGSAENRSDRSPRPQLAPASQPPTTTLTDPVDVFQKAFWKRPTDGDQILHAERREWADKSGLQHWNWHLSVKPSAALVDHLITDNAFMLTKGSKALSEESPEWFPQPGGDIQCFTNAAGTFQLLWDKENNLIHATDNGGGFRPGAREFVRPIVDNLSAGRLPATPPPKP